MNAPAPRPTQRILQLVAGSLVLILSTGCQTVQDYSLTYRLWHPADSGNLSEPASQTGLAIFEATRHHDLLVHYNAWSDSKRALVRRAYLLKPNQNRIAKQKKPRFVDPSMANGLPPVPIVSSLNSVSPGAPWTAVYPESLDGRPAFGLYQQGKAVGLHPLPAYAELAGGTTGRVLLTPPAAVGDVVMVGVVASVVAFYAWVFLGAPGS